MQKTYKKRDDFKVRSLAYYIGGGMPSTRILASEAKQPKWMILDCHRPAAFEPVAFARTRKSAKLLKRDVEFYPRWF